MNSRELLLNGCRRLLDYIVKVRQNLVGPQFLGRYCPARRKENHCWDALIDIDTERLCDIDIAVELSDVDIEDNEMFLLGNSAPLLFPVLLKAPNNRCTSRLRTPPSKTYGWSGAGFVEHFSRHSSVTEWRCLRLLFPVIDGDW